MIQKPFFREAGSGPGVVCLHANASSSGQWRALMDLLAPRHRVLAPDLYDSGKGPRWPSDSVIRLGDEVAMLEPVLAAAGSPLALVGHSYGGAVALVAALMNPGRVRALALYEPTLFSLIEAEKRPPNDADGIRNAVAASVAALEAGDANLAAQHFIDYWMWTGAWQNTPDERKPAIAAAVANIRRWAHALMTEPTPLEAFRALDIPVLYLTGKRTTASARGVARLLTATLPRVEVVELDGLGHMGPVTHPHPVNEKIREFLEGVAMDMSGIPFGTTDWAYVKKTEHKGESGAAFSRTETFNGIRVRMVEYTPGYVANHWCRKGHILLCLEGELHTELEDGRTFTLRPGMSYQVADGAEPHRSHTRIGAKLFIVD